MDPSQMMTLVEGRKWVPIAAVVIYTLIRLLKSDTKIPIDVPARARIWLVFGLGTLSGVLEKVTQGGTWTEALMGGAVSVAMAVLFHESIIASGRAGKELPVPGLIKPGAPPSPSAPVTLPAPPNE